MDKLVENLEKQNISNENIKEAIKILNNVLYFRDDSDYQTALFDALSKLTGLSYDNFPNEFIED